MSRASHVAKDLERCAQRKGLEISKATSHAPFGRLVRWAIAFKVQSMHGPGFRLYGFRGPMKAMML